MASRIMTLGDIGPMKTQEDFVEALSRFEHASEEEVRGWIDKVGIDESDFEPLDNDVKNEIDRLSGVQVQQMTRNWKNGWTGLTLPEEFLDPLSEWRRHLDVPGVGAYCAAAGALIRSLLLDASAGTEAVGRIESLQQSPTLYVFAQPGSVLAREEGFEEKGISKRMSPTQFGHRIALRCGEVAPWGELAWRFLAGSFVEMEVDNVLPRVAIRRIGDGALEVSL